MLFNSFEFIVFLPLVLLIYYSLPWRWQNRFLVLASIFFYASWNWKFIFPLLFSTCVDYWTSRRMAALLEHHAPRRALKPYLFISVVSNLGLLGFFKYCNFFSESLQLLLLKLGLSIPLGSLEIILPVGISFYTFQALAYTIDVYRGESHAADSFWDFFLAVLYFPHLVAGPIQRASNLLKQVCAPRSITIEKWMLGLHLIFCGYLKKVLLADNLAPIVNEIFAKPSASGAEVALACYAFAIQIYCDFSGYTDIARGVAKLMGFEFMLNFNLPYFARSPRDFWRRWHISLSTWLKDYLYVSLGGNRSGRLLTLRNLLVTMLLGGLWHGAAWNFVLWGLYHGLLLAGQHLLEGPWGKFCRRHLSGSAVLRNLAFTIVMFTLTLYGWLLFRAESLAQISVMTEALFLNWGSCDSEQLNTVLFFSAPLWLVQFLEFKFGALDLFERLRVRAELRVFCYSVITYLVLFRGGVPQSFIYFQF